MKESHVWFLTDAKHAKSIFDDWSVEKSQCNGQIKNLQKQSGAISTELTTICNSLSRDELNQLVKEAVEAQKTMGIVIGLAAFFWMLWGIFQSNAIDAAHKIIANIKKRNEQNLK